MKSEEIRARIVGLLESTHRDGIIDLIEWMDLNGFFTAPCSGQYHLCYVGGLAEHSLNVYNMQEKLHCLMINTPKHEIGHYDTWIIVSLLHDLGKTGQYGKLNYVPNLLKSGELSSSKPYTTNGDLLYVPHEVRSIQIASEFIKLSEIESYAILMHNGLYGDMKYAYSGKETPLSMLLHFADMWASRVIEK